MKRIAITGEGIVSAIGIGKEQVRDALVNHKTGIGEMKYLDSIHHELPVAEVKMSNEQMMDMLGMEYNPFLSRTTLMGIMAVKQALDDADIAYGQTNKIEQAVLVSGTTVGGMDITENLFAKLDTSDELLECLKHHECGDSTNDIASYFACFKDTSTISTACSSAANAIILGTKLLQAGLADIVVAGGTEALSKFHLNGFNSLMILDHEPCRPFDEQRNGLNLGEGAAFIVLETEEHAKKRNADIHAYITGYGNACDAFHQTATSENGEGAFLAMMQALDMANLKPQDIDYINAHGTGTQNNDATECVAIKRVFNESVPPVSSTKGFTGHTTSASGSIETVISLIAMRNSFIPVNIGWKQPMTDGIIPITQTTEKELNHILCNSFGFGGNDSAIIISANPCQGLNNIMMPEDVKVLAQVEINDESQLEDIKQYVKPLAARRMGKVMKSSLLASLKALEIAGIQNPDAVITATPSGSLEYSENIMKQMKEEGEDSVKPTFFMQSTHNTIGSNIAIFTKCHGYNVTFSHGSKSLEWAIRDAKLLLAQGKCKNVLVGFHEESTPLYNSFLNRLGEKPKNSVKSIAMILSC